jgi:large subunit ribosomal protein L1
MSSKRLNKIYKEVDSTKYYNISEAIKLVKLNSNAKFDESIDIAFNLNIDPKYQDQFIREVVQMPEGLGKEIKIAVIAKSDKHEEAKKAGADFVGDDELVAEIKSGKTDFDVCIATPDSMSKVGQLGRVLGPKGLMPNPKLGTVTNDVVKAIGDAKKGQVEIKADKYGIIHASIAKSSFDESKIANNFTAIYEAVKSAKPSGVKGVYIKKLCIGSTMGATLMISLQSLND